MFVCVCVCALEMFVMFGVHTASLLFFILCDVIIVVTTGLVRRENAALL